MIKLILPSIQVLALIVLCSFGSFSYAICTGTTSKITLNNNSTANTGHLQLWDHTEGVKLCTAGDQSKCDAQACLDNEMRVISTKYSGHHDFTCYKSCSIACTNDGGGMVCMTPY
jgi:hypothetical protein